MPFIGANILQAILFGLAHMNIIQGFYAFGLGLLFGYVAYRYKTIVASIILHMLYNAFNFFPIPFSSKQIFLVIYSIIGTVILIGVLYKYDFY